MAVGEGSRPDHVLRSLLFSPGADERKVEKAATGEADAVILDLEDSVADSRKFEARALVARTIARHGGDRILHVRVNAASTGLMEDDLAAICRPGLAAVWLPKAERTEDVVRVDALLTRLETERDLGPGSVRLMLSLETALGVHFAYELVICTARVAALSAGTAEGGDLHAELGGLWSEDIGTVPHVRARVLVAARAAGLCAVIDGACTRLDDETVSHSSKAARDAGYSGKMAIHPRHVPLIHRAFAPTADEVDHAHAVIAEFAVAEANGIAAIRVGGRMIDYAMVVNARRVLREADGGEKGTELP